MPSSVLRTSILVGVAAIFMDLSLTGAFGQAAGGGGASGAAGAAGGPVGGAGASGGIGGGGIGGGAAGVGAGSSGAGVSGGAVGGGGLGGGSLNSAAGSLGGAHQGNILTGPGASGIPQNYFRGAMPGMGQFPQQGPSGSLGSGSGVSGRRGANRGGSGLGTGSRAGGGGRAIGRGVGPAPKGGDENPAETLLNEMNGTNNGRRTGRAALRPEPKYQRGKRGMSSDPPSLTPQRIEERAVYFAKRGAYEDMVYHPYQGSYRRANGRSSSGRTASAPRPPVRSRQVY
jgi:hypothetical protein